MGQSIPPIGPRTDKRTPYGRRCTNSSAPFGKAAIPRPAALLAATGGKAEAVRQLPIAFTRFAKRLGQAEDARAYNELITVGRASSSAATARTQTRDRFAGCG